MEQNLRRTPMYDFHKRVNAKLVPFAGWEMPVTYTELMAEHRCVREKVGLFDVSHMGEIFITGPKALEMTSLVSTNDPVPLRDGQVAYSAFCNERGGIVDDFTLYRFHAEKFLLVVNAANTAKDFQWVKSHELKGSQVENQSDAWAQLAIQGPKAQKVLQALVREDLEKIAYYAFAEVTVGGVPAIVSRTGYTGEDGFEVYYPAAQGLYVWEALMEKGAQEEIQPIGLGARDTLRLEMGYALYGNDIDDQTNPLEAGLGWITKLKNRTFLGSQALLQQKERGLSRRLCGLVMEDKLIPRHGYPLRHEGRVVGQVTSGTFSPFLRNGIALGYLEAALLDAGVGQVNVEGRGGKCASAKVVKPPFVRSQVRK